ncbi:hypothetical protein RCH09_003328 [Actimicrobium sp. GrIS 1.19]|uniref:hypothetical protein n=1 Tax=Actimicrobium sp. GrIS 1.19 TaxID=3071708 RepID=UPI002E06AD51|nr:hypothetical protein [Actimicrobium sp. GrIS 1.19]
MNKILLALLTGAMLATLTPAIALAADAGTPAVKRHVAKKTDKKSATPAAAELAAPDDDDNGAPIDAAKSLAVEYKCELGNNITIFHNDGDEKYIALRWKNLITRMQRVGTTTGAHRFENKRSGLVWVGIPAKGILLDSKKGQQLANECKNPEQAAPKVVEADTVKS